MVSPHQLDLDQHLTDLISHSRQLGHCERQGYDICCQKVEGPVSSKVSGQAATQQSLCWQAPGTVNTPDDVGVGCDKKAEDTNECAQVGDGAHPVQATDYCLPLAYDQARSCKLHISRSACGACAGGLWLLHIPHLQQRLRVGAETRAGVLPASMTSEGLHPYTSDAGPLMSMRTWQGRGRTCIRPVALSS